MSDFNFKADDKVYYPAVSHKVLTLRASTDGGPYTVELVWGAGGKDSFTSDGKRHHTDLNPSIFPATEEWHGKLVSAYPNLEEPIIKRTPKEIIQAMLDSTDYNEVLAYVSDEPIEQILQKHKIALIYHINAGGKFVASDDIEYEYAVPYCHKAGKKIVGFDNGKEILED